MSYEVIEKLKKAIESHETKVKWEASGKVIEVGDGVARIAGIPKVKSQEVINIETDKGNIPALALNLEEEIVGALILGEEGDVRSDAKVTQTGNVPSVEVGEEMMGRVVDPLGRPLDGLGPIFKQGSKPSSENSIGEHADRHRVSTTGKPERYFLEKKAPSVLDREPVRTPLHTGVKAVDAMIPIGRGQRELVIGDRQTGKTALVLDAIINQGQDKGRETPVCIYVAIGQKESKIAQLVQTLKEKDALRYTIVVSAPASSPAAFWYLAPYAGCAIGEYFMDKGKDALVVYDDLSKHAWSYRQISLLLRRPPGREAYPGDVFYLHSRLLERAAKLNAAHGGGSLTALPIIETQLGDISAYIPTNVISITDGQIYLESDLFYQGIRPAVNVGLSVSRVGSSAQTKAMKKVAGRMRLELAQFRELQAFVQFASEVDEATKKRIVRGELLTEILKQSDLEPVSLERQVVVLYAAINGFLDGIERGKVAKAQTELIEYIEGFHAKEILEPLATKGEITEEVEKALQGALAKWKSERS